MNVKGFYRVGWTMMLFVSCAGAVGQTTADGVSARLVGKTVYLRGMWGEDKLSFNGDGQPIKTYKVVPFAEAGFEAKSVKLIGDQLAIEGQRVVFQFSQGGKMTAFRFSKMTINVTSAAGGDFGEALDAIFVPDLVSLTPLLPDYWQDYARKHFLPAEAPGASNAQPGPPKTERAMHAGGSVKPPRVLNVVDPLYTEAAKAVKFSGNVQVYLWIEDDGSTSHLKVVGPVGMGLDDMAVAAVRQYKFAPATQDGKPVKVDLYIDVNFQIF